MFPILAAALSLVFAEPARPKVRWMKDRQALPQFSDLPARNPYDAAYSLRLRSTAAALEAGRFLAADTNPREAYRTDSGRYVVTDTASNVRWLHACPFDAARQFIGS